MRHFRIVMGDRAMYADAEAVDSMRDGASPVLGEGKPLCPPVKSSIRVDTVIMQGAGDVAVQVWSK